MRDILGCVGSIAHGPGSFIVVTGLVLVGPCSYQKDYALVDAS